LIDLMEYSVVVASFSLSWTMVSGVVGWDCEGYSSESCRRVLLGRVISYT
jgi:hypothetical protein